MGILRTDRVSGLGGANAIKGSVEMRGAQNLRAEIVNSNADFNLGSSDFTIECWLYRGGTTGTTNSLDQDLVMLWNNTDNRRSYGLYYDSGGYLGLIGSSDGTNSNMQSYHSYDFPDANAWYHIAAVRISNTVTVYVNGTSIGSATVSGSFYENTQDNLVIGGQLSGTNYDNKIVQGFLSNVRIIIGDGIYTGAFTPPTNELTVTANTKLLCCQSPGNVLQEATGKTLVAYRSSSNNSFPLASHFTPNSPVGFSTTTDVGTQFGSTFDGVTTFDGFGSFATSTYMVPPNGNTRERNRGRAVLGGGYESAQSTDMQFFEVQSQGNTLTFGDLTQARWIPAAYASSTRACFAGGGTPSRVNTIDFVTIATTSNATNFGDLTSTRTYFMGYSSSTRGIAAGGGDPNLSDVIDYVTIATTGDATDFGNLTVARQEVMSACSPTRGLTMGGFLTPNPSTNVVDYVTIATTGDATDFGDMTAGSGHGAATSDNTRAIFAGGYSPGTTYTKKIEFFTTASTGNGTDFGDLITAVITSYGMPSDNTRGVLCGGYVQPTNINSMQQITIQSTGDAVDFGDVTVIKRGNGGTSDSHGGLS